MPIRGEGGACTLGGGGCTLGGGGEGKGSLSFLGETLMYDVIFVT